MHISTYCLNQPSGWMSDFFYLIKTSEGHLGRTLHLAKLCASSEQEEILLLHLSVRMQWNVVELWPGAGAGDVLDPGDLWRLQEHNNY